MIRFVQCLRNRPFALRLPSHLPQWDWSSIVCTGQCSKHPDQLRGERHCR